MTQNATSICTNVHKRNSLHYFFNQIASFFNEVSKSKKIAIIRTFPEMSIRYFLRCLCQYLHGYFVIRYVSLCT
jgi:hypothetical protein